MPGANGTDEDRAVSSEDDIEVLLNSAPEEAPADVEPESRVAAKSPGASSGDTRPRPKTPAEALHPAEDGRLYPPIYDAHIDSLEKKPWRNSGADATDFFNYGFNEATWRAYCARQVQMRMELRLESSGRARKRSASAGSSDAASSCSEDAHRKHTKRERPRYKRVKRK